MKATSESIRYDVRGRILYSQIAFMAQLLLAIQTSHHKRDIQTSHRTTRDIHTTQPLTIFSRENTNLPSPDSLPPHLRRNTPQRTDHIPIAQLISQIMKAYMSLDRNLDASLRKHSSLGKIVERSMLRRHIHNNRRENRSYSLR